MFPQNWSLRVKSLVTFGNFRQRWWELTNYNHHCSWTFTKNRDINLDRFFMVFSWKLFVKCDNLLQKMMVVHGLIRRGKLISAGRIYETFELYARQLSSVAGHFKFSSFFSKKKKMSCQYQLPLQGILLDFTFTRLPLNFTEVGHIVQWVSKL